MITVALPNSVEWFVAFAACWKIGAIPQPVSASCPARELEAILELADPSVVIGVPQELTDGRRSLPIGYRPDPDLPDDPLPDVTSPGMEGTDLRRVDRPTETHCVGRPGTLRPGRTTALRPGRRLHGRARSAVPQRSDRLVVFGVVGAEATWSSFLVSTPRPRWRQSTGYRADTVYLVPTMMKRIWRLPEEVRDSYDLSVPRFRLASGRALPALAQGGVDRLARTGPHLRALRRHRGAGSHHHHRDRMARPSRFGGPADAGHGHDLRCRRQRAAGRARRRGLVADRPRATDLPLRRRRRLGAAKADGNPSATWGGSTTTATCTWVTGSRT